MIFKRITSEDKPSFEFVEKLYIESFPPEERRSIPEFKKLMDEDSSFCVNVVLDGDKLIGFLTYWKLSSFIYAEHFAISSDFRNEGYGKKTLEAFTAELKYPLVLEVEMPEDEIAVRRIGFYQRGGLRAWDIPYVQPSYGAGLPSLAMMLMTYGDIDLNVTFETVKEDIYRKVYNVF